MTPIAAAVSQCDRTEEKETQYDTHLCTTASCTGTHRSTGLDEVVKDTQSPLVVGCGTGRSLHHIRKK